MGKEQENHLPKMPLDNIVKGCIYHLNEEVTSRKQTPALFYEFREHLTEAIKSVPPPPKGQTPIPQLSFMLEDFIRGASRIIVLISSIAPGVLERNGELSKDQASLVRRGMEDYLIGLTEQMLKKHVLDDHIEYDNFRSTKEGSYYVEPL